MSNTIGTAVAVPIASAWQSKINWTQLAGVAISAATAFSGVLPEQYAVPAALAIQTAQSLLTWYFKTFQTTTITPSSAAKLP